MKSFDRASPRAWRFVVWFAGVSISVVAATGCRARTDAAPGGVIDSAVPRDVALAKFQRGMASVSDLQGGAASRDELVARFVAALEARDTTALLQLVITRAEFGYLYYPTTPQGLPPYDLSPDLMWFMVVERGNRGMHLALGERGGAPLHSVGYTCDGQPSREGSNTVWGPCSLRRLGERGDTVSERLFGLIIERNGRFKFISYANQFD